MQSPDRRPCVCRGYLEVQDPTDDAEVAAVQAAHNLTPRHRAYRASLPVPIVTRAEHRPLTPELIRELVGPLVDPETDPPLTESELRALDGNR